MSISSNELPTHRHATYRVCNWHSLHAFVKTPVDPPHAYNKSVVLNATMTAKFNAFHAGSSTQAC